MCPPARTHSSENHKSNLLHLYNENNSFNIVVLYSPKSVHGSVSAHAALQTIRPLGNTNEHCDSLRLDRCYLLVTTFLINS